MNVLTGSFSALSDPREDRKVIYPLTDILVIAVCAAIAGAESYEDIAGISRGDQVPYKYGDVSRTEGASTIEAASGSLLV